MSTLHTLNKLTGGSGDVLSRCLSAITCNDILLLQEDAVFSMIEGMDSAKKILDLLPVEKVFCLADDVNARGLMEKLVKGIKVISFADYVMLTERHEKVISWF